MMRRTLILIAGPLLILAVRLLLFLAVGLLLCACTPRQESLEDLGKRVFRLAETQLADMDKALAPGQCPRSFAADTLQVSDIGWWCSGFYPGCLWLTYEYSGNVAIRDLALKHTLPLEGLLARHTDHDIGFQLMCSYGNMLRLTGNGREVLEKGAEKLAARFCPGAGILRSWDFGDWHIPVIIDNMMNLELLTAFGDKALAEKHACTTAQNHFREDGTCFHLVDYADDGQVLGRQTVQGYADSTAWARGQAWALYGFAMMARDGNKDYLDVAVKLENWLLGHLPDDGIPFWDFSQSDYKDASAAAIIACGLLELCEIRGDRPSSPSFRMAEKIVRTLASEPYLAAPGTNGGFLLKHSVGNLPAHSEVDVPLTYADYYFLKAVMRLANKAQMT